jgi:hypothetical protein
VDAFVRDFLASTRLDYLHTLLLLDLASEPNIRDLKESTISIASAMLSLTFEMVILRDRFWDVFDLEGMF